MASTSRTTLSKESLYAPLSVYIPKAPQKQVQDDASTSKGRKSPTSDGGSGGGGVKFLNIPRELREPALLEHLSAISATYHHPTMSASLTSGAAGSDGSPKAHTATPRAKAKAMGMGRNNGGRALPRRSYEDRLLQRSLVLVGGGLMTSVVGTDGIAATSTGDANGGGGADGGPDQPASRHVVDVSRAQRRRRRRGRGHRIRGSISNSERKRRELEGGETTVESAAMQAEDKGDGSRKRKRSNGAHGHDTLLRLTDMWNAYISKLLGLEQDADGAPTTSSRKSIWKRSAAEMSALLSTAELIGAFVKIDRCDASRSYVGKEGVVVDSTANTWRIAIPKPVIGKTKKKQKDESDGKGSRDIEKNSNGERKDIKSLGIVWREVVVPKRRSRLSFSVDSDVETSNETKFRFMIGENS